MKEKCNVRQPNSTHDKNDRTAQAKQKSAETDHTVASAVADTCSKQLVKHRTTTTSQPQSSIVTGQALDITGQRFTGQDVHVTGQGFTRARLSE